MLPLLKPTESILLILDPRPRHLKRLDITFREPTAHNLATAHHAAHIAKVSAYLASNDPVKQDEPWIVLAPQPIAAGDTYVLPAATDNWAESSLGRALTTTNRGNLVMRGLWLECTVTFTALTAIVEGFDVFVLMDATPSWLADTP